MQAAVTVVITRMHKKLSKWASKVQSKVQTADSWCKISLIPIAVSEKEHG